MSCPYRGGRGARRVVSPVAGAKEARDVDESKPATPVFLAIGHAVKDVVPGGWRWGGTVTYAALLARAWGLPVAVVTSLAAEDAPGYQALLGDGALLHVVPAPATTTMENTYTETGREQRLHAKATQILPRHVPAAWRSASVVLVGPVLHDVSTKFAGFFPEESLVGLTTQGRLRGHNRGRIYRRLWPRAEHEFPAYDVLFFSDEDVGFSVPLAEAYAELAPLALETRGDEGARLFDSVKRKAYEFDAAPARDVDPTGAGDVFAAAFLITYAAGGDPIAAAYHANAAAACSIEREGVNGIPTWEQVEARLRSALDLDDRKA